MTGDPKSIKTAKRHYLNNSAPLDQQALGDELIATSDRAVVINVAAILDSALPVAMATKLRLGSDEEFERAFENNGPISTFSARIDLAYWLMVIDRQARDQLHTIRELRNICAHSRLPIDLLEPRLAAVVRRAIFPTGIFRERPDDPRGLRKALVAEALHLHGVILQGREAALESTRESYRRRGQEPPV